MINHSFISKLTLTACLFFISTLIYAQLDVDIDIGKSKWYEDPKVWVGVAIFLVVLAFIARGRKS